MGWWSATVLGGDTPLDWLGMLCDVMGVDYRDDDDCHPTNYYGYAYTRELVEKHLDELVAKVKADTYDPHIGYQVLGAIVLQVGAEIPDPVRDDIVKAATMDAWANEGAEDRKAFMQDLVDKMLAHKPGQCVELATEGLLEKIFERLKGGAQA